MKAAAASDSAPAEVAVDRKAVLNDTLRRHITGMELAPGAVIDEVTLAEEFGLSRPPVRELMRQLAAEGYIELEPNRPARVAAMGYQSMRSFFLAAPLIYVATTQLAAQHASAEEIAGLKQIQAQFRAAIEQNDLAARTTTASWCATAPAITPTAVSRMALPGAFRPATVPRSSAASRPWNRSSSTIPGAAAWA